MLYSTIDDIVRPRESGWFEFYPAHSQAAVVPLRQSAAYQSDLIGLRTLDESGRLWMYSCDCRHQDYPTEACHAVFNAHTLPFLNTTVSAS